MLSICLVSSAIREAYIQNGGNDQILINQLRQMEQDARDLEEEMKRRQQEKPKGTDAVMSLNSQTDRCGQTV